MPQNPARILIIRPSALGDVCRTVPALVSLREAYPHAQIDWLVQEGFAEAIRHHPALSNAIEFRRHEIAAGLWGGTTAPFFQFLKRLRDTNYDAVYDLQGLFRSGFIALATRAPRRVGLSNARELGWLGLTHRYLAPTSLHAVERMLEVLRQDGISTPTDMRLYTDPEARKRVREDPELASGPYALVAPTSRWESKRWPAERFARVSEELLRRGYARVVLVGAPSERGQCEPLIRLASAEPRVLDRIGTTSLADLLALTEASSFVLANDSAVIHLAVGFNRPLIGLYGPTDPAKDGPFGRIADVIYHPPSAAIRHRRLSTNSLMLGITTDEVVARIPTPGSSHTQHQSPAAPTGAVSAC